MILHGGAKTNNSVKLFFINPYVLLITCFLFDPVVPMVFSQMKACYLLLFFCKGFYYLNLFFYFKIVREIVFAKWRKSVTIQT